MTVNAVGWPVILIPEGATEITIEKSAIDQMYRPPYVRSNKQRQWVDWSATQSGIRHNSGTERRNGTIELLFRVVYWQKGSFVAGKTSDEKLVITQFYVTKTAGPVFKRRYDLLRA
uniref:Uncharacterized protein n=1 Tax=uncultured bacterium contig00055 TaxID=1181539 RepID=A0A806KFW1_9BACT|nr:hypothetical protein [uncultured bacterium contig00055]